MNTKAQEYDKKEIPLLVRSRQWKIEEKTENQISAVCLKNNQDDITMKMNQKIVQQNQKIDSQNTLINQQSQMIELQNKKIDDLNDLLRLQENKNAELRNRIEILERIEQNKDKGKTVARHPISNEIVKSPAFGSRTNILMADSNPGSNTTVLGSEIKRCEISSIYTKNTLKNIPISAWDVSDSQDSSVMAWTEKADDGRSLILYLAANGDIYANPDSSYLFSCYHKLIAADFTYLKTELVTDMSGMFEHCNLLEELEFYHWDTSSVISMNSMFSFCDQLQVLKVDQWNVSNVTNMNHMFAYCKLIQSLDVSNWDVSKVADMNYMFCECIRLQSIDVSHWNVSNVTNMDYMFYSCLYITGLQKGALSSWKLNPNVSMENICGGTKFQRNPTDLFYEKQGKTEQNKDTEIAVSDSKLIIPDDTEKSPSTGSQTAVLMADSNINSNSIVFGSQIKRRDISHIYVKNTLKDTPASAWDVSDSRDGSVMAWTDIASDGETLILYLAANGDIYANPDSSNLFAKYTKLTTADFTHLKTDLVTRMNSMFNSCHNLKQLDISDWNVSNVTTMRGMFNYCEQLQNLDVSKWNISNVTTMRNMFSHCKHLSSIDVSNWNVSNVTTMHGMFNYCEQLQNLDVSKWNVSNVTNMNCIFSSCKQLSSIDISNWNVLNVTNMDSMFFKCPAINQMKKGTFSSWKLNPSVTMRNICWGTKFQDKPMDLFNEEFQEEANNKTNAPSILMANPNLSIFTGGNVFGSKVKRRQISAIYTKNTLENIPSSAWDVSDAKDRSVMAWTEMNSNSKMYTLYLAADGYIYANPKSYYLFSDYRNLVDVDFTYLKTDLVTDMHNMFNNCNQLKFLNASHWNVSNVTNMKSMFWNCQQLESLNISQWDVSSVTNMKEMFWHCNQLKALDISQWDVSNVADMASMFWECNQLQSLDISHWNISKANTTNMFDGCRRLDLQNH